MYFTKIKTFLKKNPVNEYITSAMLYADPDKNMDDTESMLLGNSQSEGERQETSKSQLRHHLSQEAFP